MAVPDLSRLIEELNVENYKAVAKYAQYLRNQQLQDSMPLSTDYDDEQASYKEKRESALNELFGLWRDHDEIDDVPAYVRTLRKGRKF